MSSIDFSHLSPQERLDLIGELWDSLTPDKASLSITQKAEIDRRLGTLDHDIANGRDADDILADLRNRHG